MDTTYEREVKRLCAAYLPVPPQCSHLVWYSIIRITDSGIHRYGTRRNQQRAMEGLQAELAEMRIRMNQFMEVVQGVAQGQQEIRLLVQGNPPTTQPEVVADPPAGEANGPNGPGPIPIPIPHGNLGQQPIQDIYSLTPAVFGGTQGGTPEGFAHLDKDTVLSHVLVDTAFDGSKRSVFGEVELPIQIGSQTFNTVFYVIDISPSYNCLLGRPWIHNVGAVSSTLHQKIKFPVNERIITVCGEEDILVSNLSTFKYVEVEGEIHETLCQAFEAVQVKDAAPVEEVEAGASLSSFKQAQALVNSGVAPGWGRLVDLPVKEDKFGIGCTSPDPIDNSSAMARFDFENPIFQAEEEGDEDCELPEELARLLKQEERVIQLHQESTEVINLDTEDVKREIKIGVALEDNVKKGLIELLQEYVDIFAWSYQDMPGLDTDIVVHRLPLKEDCPPVKQKLRRTRPEMAIKIKEEVQKQLDAGFLAVTNYPP
ncbi:hypothetical protein KIW84_044275 [Lathyrus oleraceus]|uniref:Uncharacterized protein n=1 Tax=Pisum sativum TaxID=3888 RepID=A0A9D4XFZ2_PEA|nr:hypothetical protein KIW84_044275 [Pisum sativum]